MPAPRFTIVQLFLAATLIALLLGLFTAAARLGPQDKVCQLCFSPSGNLLAARYESGAVGIWRLNVEQPRLIARAFGVPPTNTVGGHWLMECIYFVDDDRLIKV